LDSSRPGPLPSRSSLQVLIERCGIKLTSVQYDKLWAYHGRLRAVNPRLNLTRIHNFENMVLKHYVDSLLVLQFLELPSPLVDMGTGAGLPGIPLKIARPDVTMILAEPRRVRAEFLNDVCDRLGLRDVEVYPHKVGPGFPRVVAGVITRAVATIPDTLDRVAECLGPGGQAIFMKGPGCDEEIACAASSHGELFRLSADHAYEIPGTPHARRLLVYERLDVPESPIRPEARPPYGGPVREVTSTANPTFKLARDLLTGRGIRKHKQAIMSGPRPVAEVLARHREHVLAWLTPPDGPCPPGDFAPDLIWIRIAEPLFRMLDTFGTHAPLLIVRVPEIAEWSDEAAWPEGCTLFVPFQDPENVGAVIRSAAALGAARVVLLKEAAHPFHPKSARAAGTALFQVPLLHGPALDELATRNVPLIALATEGAELGAEPFPKRFGLVAGLEGPGLPERLRTGPCRRIPMAAEVESLNAASAVAVALYEWRRSRTKPTSP
jgi:16S rRNA (guanine(527)-N(7))-methyltransferase RsmG